MPDASGFFLPDQAPFSLPPNDPTLFYLQRLRDESHRFVIGSHRARRTKATTHSSLEDIEGIGAARRRALLRHFGSRQAIAAASIEDLCQAPAINRKLAALIYEFFHPTAMAEMAFIYNQKFERKNGTGNRVCKISAFFAICSMTKHDSSPPKSAMLT